MAASSRPSRVDVTLKISLAGDAGVGKTSVVRRFVSNTFDNRYVTTLGTKVSSRRFSVEDPERTQVFHDIGATVWDVMGNPVFRDLLREAYYTHTGGLLLVCDWTRPETLDLLPEWYDAVRTVCGDVPTVVLVNKSDLATEKTVIQQSADAVCAREGWRWLPTSAKTGENVEAAFQLLAQLYLRKMRQTEPDPPRPFVRIETNSPVMNRVL